MPNRNDNINTATGYDIKKSKRKQYVMDKDFPVSVRGDNAGFHAGSKSLKASVTPSGIQASIKRGGGSVNVSSDNINASYTGSKGRNLSVSKSAGGVSGSLRGRKGSVSVSPNSVSASYKGASFSKSKQGAEVSYKNVTARKGKDSKSVSVKKKTRFGDANITVGSGRSNFTKKGGYIKFGINIPT